MKEKSYGICPYIIDNGKIFILLNKTNCTSFNYNFFKGKIEEGETIEETAIREFQEEAGIIIDKIHLEEYFFQNGAKHIGIYLVDFSNYIEKDFKFQTREIYSAAWIDINNTIMVPNNQSVILNNIILYLYQRLPSLNRCKVVNKYNLKSKCPIY